MVKYEIKGYKKIFNGNKFIKITLGICKEIFKSSEYEHCKTIEEYWRVWRILNNESSE